jgi:transglutaminase-like putative cysteine protease
MRLEITHETRYTYSAPVRESVMELWLQPLTLPMQRLVGFDIVTEPRAKLMTYRDWLGNIVYHFDVPAKHTELVIRSRAMVETYERTDPLPKKVDPGAWAHLRSDEVCSRYYDMMRPSTFVDGSGHLQTFMRERDLLELPPDPLTGLRILNKEIYGAFDYVSGFTAADSPIDAALEHRKGVCQDFAHIMLAVARLHENRREPLDALPHITVRHEQRLGGGGIRIEESEVAEGPRVRDSGLQ